VWTPGPHIPSQIESRCVVCARTRLRSLSVSTDNSHRLIIIGWTWRTYWMLHSSLTPISLPPHPPQTRPSPHLQHVCKVTCACVCRSLRRFPLDRQCATAPAPPPVQPQCKDHRIKARTCDSESPVCADVCITQRAPALRGDPIRHSGRTLAPQG
jgi:hypothetical protein